MDDKNIERIKGAIWDMWDSQSPKRKNDLTIRIVNRTAIEELVRKIEEME